MPRERMTSFVQPSKFLSFIYQSTEASVVAVIPYRGSMTLTNYQLRSRSYRYTGTETSAKETKKARFLRAQT